MAKQIGIFGGSFNPFHHGHLNSVLEIFEKVNLNKIILVPSFQSPLRKQVDGPSAEQRLSLVKAGIQGHEDRLEVSDVEIRRQGVSYTIDTLKELKKKEEAEYFLIIGLDQFYKFDQWKNYLEILNEAQLVVTSRPGQIMPFGISDFPAGLVPQVVDFDGKRAMLKNENTIDFVQLDDVDLSATDIRKKIRSGQSIHGMVPFETQKQIDQEGFYKNWKQKIGDFAEFTLFCAQFLESKSGINVQAYDLREVSSTTEFSLVASGTSTRSSAALAENLMDAVHEEYGVWPQGSEGITEGRWIVLDYGSLMVHIFYDFVRLEYRMENLWKNGKMMEIKK